MRFLPVPPRKTHTLSVPNLGHPWETDGVTLNPSPRPMLKEGEETADECRDGTELRYLQAAPLTQSHTQRTKSGMGKYKIAIVERGKEALWREYWINSDSQGTADAAPADLGRTEVVEATSLAKAIDAVRSRHPNCTVMLAGGEHHVS